jgi:methionyl-tRNA formyltransferase
LRIIFMGTPDFSVPVLSQIIAAGHEVVAVYTRAPKPGGRRGLDLTPSPVQVAAEKSGLKVFSPKTLRTDEEAALYRSHAADVAVVVAYGLILPKPILDAPAKVCLNLHGSLLPRWRGAAPIQRAIMAGDVESGVMVMRMEEGLDTGPVALTARIAIGPDMTAGELHDQLSLAGADLMVSALALLAEDKLAFTPQSEDGVIYAQKIDKAEARIDWSKPAREVHNIIRGLSPFPGAYFEADFGKGAERVKVLRSTLADAQGVPGSALDEALTIACGQDAIRLTEVQRSGKAPMQAQDFLRGTKVATGTILQ